MSRFESPIIDCCATWLTSRGWPSHPPSAKAAIRPSIAKDLLNRFPRRIRDQASKRRRSPNRDGLTMRANSNRRAGAGAPGKIATLVYRRKPARRPPHRPTGAASSALAASSTTQSAPSARSQPPTPPKARSAGRRETFAIGQIKESEGEGSAGRRRRSRAWSRRRGECARRRREPSASTLARMRHARLRAFVDEQRESERRATAPRSTPSAPEPAKRSITRAPSITLTKRWARMSKINSRRRSEVGRIARDEGAASARPPAIDRRRCAWR